MIAALLSLAAASSITISFKADGVPVSALVEAMREQSREQIVCDPVVAFEPIVVDIEDVPLREVQDRLAEVIGAEWIRTADEQRLTRSSTLKFQQEREDQRRISEHWSKIVDAWQKRLSSEDALSVSAAQQFFDSERLGNLPESARSAEMQRLNDASPVARAACAMAKQIGPEAMAKIEIGERVVYSNFPTPMQRALSDKAAPVLARLAKAAITVSEAKRKQIPAQIVLSGLPDTDNGNPADPGKTIFVLTKSELHRIRWAIIMADSEGRKIIGGSGSVPDTLRSLSSPLAPKGEALEISQETRNLGKLTSEAGVLSASGSSITLPSGESVQFSMWVPHNEMDNEPQDRGLGSIISDPVRNDPIGYVFGRFVRQLGNREKRHVLASAPDSLLYFLGRWIAWGQPMTDTGFEALIAGSLGSSDGDVPYCSISRREGWLLVKPGFLSVARRTRFNRTAARSLIEEIKRNRCASIENAVQYVAKTPETPSIRSVDSILISHASPDVDRTSVSALLTSPIDFFVAAGPSAWSQLAGRDVPMSQLTSAMRRILHGWVYWQNRQAQEMEWGLSGSSEKGAFWHEPTEYLPNGLPPDLVVKIRLLQSPAVIAKSTRNQHFAMSVYSWAFLEFMGGVPLEGPSEKRKLESFRPAVERVYTISLQLPQSRLVCRQLSEKVPWPGAAVPRDQLPSELLEKYERAKSLIKEQFPPP
jgi:hypothetical protein